MNTSVVPSLPAASWKELETLAYSLQTEITELQIDIVDGNFVEAISWPFTETDPVAALQQLAKLPHNITLEIDCMVREPQQYFAQFKELPITRVIIHFGSTGDIQAAITRAIESDCAVGIAFTNDVSLDEIRPLIPLVDFIQVMGIATVGAQGQPFDTRTLETIRILRAEFSELTIAVDGSVNSETIPQLITAGANRLAPGSAVAKQPDQLRAYRNLVQLVNEQVATAE